ncbi:unnamed protein product [Trypanosoma congolense IL3000]|uniref:WGS project CAEQ00000000 data, annotated contig 1588 n=1 Tax=Trypanosoma congolense (strain IL3000) TaxID=1068625 RepID=F9W798_TRYCI|nr:unnamed protein product [Trypanosoma congolense IL3000]
MCEALETVPIGHPRREIRSGIPSGKRNYCGGDVYINHDPVREGHWHEPLEHHLKKYYDNNNNNNNNNNIEITNTRMHTWIWIWMCICMYVCVCVEMHSTEGRNEVLGEEAPKRFMSSMEKENGSLQHRCGAKPQCHPIQHPNPHCHIRHAIKSMKDTAAAQGQGLEIVLQKKTVKHSLYTPLS